MSDTARTGAGESTVSVTIDGTEVAAPPDRLVIDVAEDAGVWIPRFCYHKRMRPVGMCRMCLVEIDTGRGPALQPSCMVNVRDGMEVTTESDPVTKAQDGVLEFLLINHPLDCPVCDKGGECPLQDQTMSHGPGESRFIEEKRHFEKPIPISDLVLLDRERCIQCDRCTRFADEVAGDPLIQFQGRGNTIQVNTFPDHPFSSYFSGNTVQICPVGALTAEPYRFKARPWDLEQVESTCTSCSVGCRVVIDTSRNRILRYNGIDIDPVNWGWLCDKGRFDFQAIESTERLTEPLIRDDDSDELTQGRWARALGRAATAVRDGLERSGAAGVAVIGGARLTNEDAYAWTKLAKGVIGTDHVDAQLDDGLPAEAVLGLPGASIDEVCAPGGTVVVLAGDLKEELPILFLRLRHAVCEDRVRLIELSPIDTPLTELAEISMRYRPGEATRLMSALLDGTTAPEGTDASALVAATRLIPDGPVTMVLGRPSLAEGAEAATDAAAYTLDARPGSRFLPALRRSNVRGALEMGLSPGLLPGRVRLDEGRDHFAASWPTLPEATGRGTADILAAAAEGQIDTLVLLGADPLVDFRDRDLARRGLAGARQVIALDAFLTDSAARADVVLPVATYAEGPGTTTNLEGRVSTLHHTVTAPGSARSDWSIAAELALRLGHDLGVASPAEILAEIASLAPSHVGVDDALAAQAGDEQGVLIRPEAPPAQPTPGRVGPTGDRTPGGADETAEVDPSGRTGGGDGSESPGLDAGEEAADKAAEQNPEAAKVAEDVTDAPGTDEGDAAEPPGGAAGVPEPGWRSAAEERSDEAVKPAQLTFTAGAGVAEPPAVDAYALRLVTTRSLYDRGTLVQSAPSLAGLAPVATARANPADADRLGLGTGDRARAISRRGTVQITLAADGRVPEGILAVGFNLAEVDVGELIAADDPVTDVRLETI